MSSKEKYESAVNYLDSLGVDISFNSVPENPHWGKESWEKFNFFLKFRNKEDKRKGFSMYFSQSNRKPFSFNGGMTVCGYAAAKKNIEQENRYPDLFSVLDCLVLDSDCLGYDFREWAENLGYDPDSRKAEKTYKACIDQTKKARSLFDLDEIREYLEKNDLN